MQYIALFIAVSVGSFSGASLYWHLLLRKSRRLSAELEISIKRCQ